MRRRSFKDNNAERLCSAFLFKVKGDRESSLVSFKKDSTNGGVAHKYRCFHVSTNGSCYFSLSSDIVDA